MNITTMPNGNLRMRCDDVNERADIREMREKCSSVISAEGQFICDLLPGFTQVQPEDVGALTSAPLIQKGDDVWGFMDYQILDLLEELSSGNEVRWIKG